MTVSDQAMVCQRRLDDNVIVSASSRLLLDTLALIMAQRETETESMHDNDNDIVVVIDKLILAGFFWIVQAMPHNNARQGSHNIMGLY